MNTETTSKPSTAISAAKLLSVVSSLAGPSRPPDHETPPRRPGPYDPIFRTAVKEWLTILALSDPRLYELPELGGPILRDRLSRVGLNPQPLPPRRLLMITLAETVVSRAEFLNEFATALTSDAEKRGIIIVSGYVGGFVRHVTHSQFSFLFSDHVHLERTFPFCRFCHLDLDIDVPQEQLPKLPPPPPPPDPPFRGALSGADLLVLGAAFADAARGSFDENLRCVFQDAAEQLAEAGAARVP